MGRLGVHFARPQPLAQAGKYLMGLLSDLPRKNCWTLAEYAGDGTPDRMHPMQDAFLKHDGYQCGYCTPGQIVSAVAVLAEVKAGIPSHVTADLAAAPEASNAELRERMSGNLCRCGAYSNIAEAMTEVAGRPA